MPNHHPHTTTEAVLNAAIEYVEMGFSVIPVRQSDKKPYLAWKEFQTRHPTIAELEMWWHQWPDANVAIVCGKISGIYCVDGDGPQGVQWISANLPPTPVCSQPSRGIHAIYKCPAHALIRNYVRLAPEVDIRGEGGYFVAPPSMHSSGHQYQWRFAGSWDDLPEYAPPDLTRAPAQQHAGNLSIDLSAIKENLNLEQIFGGVSEGERDWSLYRYACRLRGKGMAEHEAWFLIREMAANCNPPFPTDQALKKMESAWRHSPGEAWTQYLALEQGEVDIATDSPSEIAFPKELLNPGGILQQLMDFAEANSASSFPAFNLAGAIALLGSVAGQKIQTETGLRTNFYCFSLGYSGSGKNAPQSAFPNLLAYTKAHHILGPNEITSHAAILTTLKKKPIHIMLLDEIGHMIKSLKNPNSPAAQVPRLLNDLFTKTGAPYTKPYASTEEITLPFHHLSIYGVSTPNRFWEGLTLNDATDGFLARALIFVSEHDAPLPKSSINFKIPQRLIEEINEITDIQIDYQSLGNMQGNGKPIPRVVEKSADAKAFFEPWAAQYHQLGNQTKMDPDGASSIYRRAAEHASKLALVHALSKSGRWITDGNVELDSVQWATSLVDHVIPQTVNQIKLNISVNEYHSWEQKIVRAIERKRTHDRPGLTRRELLQSVWGLSHRNFDDLLATLQQSGWIVTKECQGKRGPKATLFCVAAKPVDGDLKPVDESVDETKQ